MNKLLITLSIIVLLMTSGCSKGLFSVHKLDIQQGNALKEENIAQIKHGMTMEQVKSALGTPVVDPMFQKNRWDYIFYLKEPDVAPVKRLVSIYFENGSVARIE